MSAESRLCSTIQGVQFTVHHGEQAVKAVIVKELLQTCFGATEAPQNWLDTYRRHQSAIDHAALAACPQQGQVSLIILREDAAGRLKATAGATPPHCARPANVL